MKSFMDYLCLTIDQMIFQSLCCLEPMEIHNPVASSYYYTVVSVFFPSSSSSLFNYLFLIITYFLRTSREVSFPFSFCLTVEPESRSRPLLSCNVCSHQRTSFLLSSFPLFRYFSVSHSFYLFPLLIIIIIIIRLTIIIILYFSLWHAIFEDFLEDRNDSRKSFAPNPNVVRRQGFMIFNSGYY